MKFLEIIDNSVTSRFEYKRLNHIDVFNHLTEEKNNDERVS